MILIAAFVAFVVLDSPLGIVALIAAGLIEVGELYFWIRFLRRYRVQTGAEGLIGRRGVVTESCPAEGLGGARIDGALWRARCEQGAEPGDEVEVLEIDGLTLKVGRTGRRG